MVSSNPIDTRAKGYERLTVSNTLHSAAELLPQLLNDEGVLNGEGSIAFTKPDRTTAKIFLRQGNVYAVDNLDYEGNLWAELRFEEHISHGNLRALIRAHKSQRDSLYKLLKRTRNKLKNEDNLVLTLQEYVLGAIDNIYSWESVKVEWRMGDTFHYDAANVPEFPLSHMLTLCVNRSLFKFNKYEEWGFKNDDQFIYGNVIVIDEKENYEPSSHLENTIVIAKKFIIKGLIENTGFSIFTIASTLDDLSKKLDVHIENPSGRQKPVNVPAIPYDVPVVEDKVYFSATDEDPDMMKVFNTEYHVPEPAILDDNEDNQDNSEESNDFDSYDDVINDTSSMEIIDANLPPLKREQLEPSTDVHPAIPQDELDREENANDIAELYKSLREVPKARGTVKKPVAVVRPAPQSETETESVDTETVEPEKSTSEQPEEAISDSTKTVLEETDEAKVIKLKGKEMSSESPLFALLSQLESQLSNQKNRIDEHQRNISAKENQLEAAKQQVARLTVELANEIGAKETATAEFEKARSILSSLNN